MLFPISNGEIAKSTNLTLIGCWRNQMEGRSASQIRRGLSCTPLQTHKQTKSGRHGIRTRRRWSASLRGISRWWLWWHWLIEECWQWGGWRMSRVGLLQSMVSITCGCCGRCAFERAGGVIGGFQMAQRRKFLGEKFTIFWGKSFAVKSSVKSWKLIGRRTVLT